jgi:hypothetical protein
MPHYKGIRRSRTEGEGNGMHTAPLLLPVVLVVLAQITYCDSPLSVR